MKVSLLNAHVCGSVDKQPRVLHSHFFYALNAYLMASEHLKRTLKLTGKVPRTPCSISLKTEEINLHKKFGLDCTTDYINMY